MHVLKRGKEFFKDINLETYQIITTTNPTKARRFKLKESAFNKKEELLVMDDNPFKVVVYRKPKRKKENFEQKLSKDGKTILELDNNYKVEVVRKGNSKFEVSCFKGNRQINIKHKGIKTSLEKYGTLNSRDTQRVINFFSQAK